MRNKIYPTLEDFRGRYAQGWTADDLEVGLRDLSRIFDRELICVWDGDKDGLFGGSSDLYLLEDDRVCDLGDGGAILDFLMEGNGKVADLLNVMRRYATRGFVANFNTLRSDPLFHRNFAWAK
jgi:hypothetical protein